MPAVRPRCRPGRPLVLPIFHALSLIVFLMLCSAPTSTLAGLGTVARAVSETSQYHKAHSLGDDYRFDPRDGWQAVNVTNLKYKYRRDQEEQLAAHKRAAKAKAMSPHHGGHGVGGLLKGVVNTLKGLVGIGKSEKVTITWYTGHDLKNPSCWANGRWSPSDSSFVAALTEYGWREKPKCFSFVELCNTPKKCVFARVVDTCAGCKKNSKHIDLTKAAFGQLADFDEGKLKVQFRMATQPDEWYEDLWGPKIKK